MWNNGETSEISRGIDHSLSAVPRVKNIVFDSSLAETPVKGDSAPRPRLRAIAPRASSFRRDRAHAVSSSFVIS